MQTKKMKTIGKVVKQIVLSNKAIVITLHEGGCGSIESLWPREEAPQHETEEEEKERTCFNAALDALESLLLSLALADVINEKNAHKADTAVHAALTELSNMYT